MGTVVGDRVTFCGVSGCAGAVVGDLVVFCGVKGCALPTGPESQPYNQQNGLHTVLSTKRKLRSYAPLSRNFLSILYYDRSNPLNYTPQP